MPDLIDQANEVADMFLAEALQRHQQVDKKATMKGLCYCLSCGADVEGERRWCDANCRDDWQKTGGR